MTRAERLADHFIQSVVAAVYVDAGGAIGIADCVGAEFPKNRALLCCAPGNHLKVAARPRSLDIDRACRRPTLWRPSAPRPPN